MGCCQARRQAACRRSGRKEAGSAAVVVQLGVHQLAMHSAGQGALAAPAAHLRRKRAARRARVAIHSGDASAMMAQYWARPGISARVALTEGYRGSSSPASRQEAAGAAVSGRRGASRRRAGAGWQIRVVGRLRWRLIEAMAAPKAAGGPRTQIRAHRNSRGTRGRRNRRCDGVQRRRTSSQSTIGRERGRRAPRLVALGCSATLAGTAQRRRPPPEAAHGGTLALHTGGEDPSG